LGGGSDRDASRGRLGRWSSMADRAETKKKEGNEPAAQPRDLFTNTLIATEGAKWWRWRANCSPHCVQEDVETDSE
jgi:hypothetical protein